MSLSMYDASVPVYRQMLGSLSAVLEKAQAHAAMRGIDPAVLLQSRLYPDMFPLTRQVQIACDAAKNGVARISGVEAPKHEDADQNLQQLQARIAEVIAFIERVPRELIDGQEERDVVVPLRTRTLQFKGRRFLLHWSLPNFFFHVATAYDILRHNGVELGKADYLGNVDG